jgi:uncharacterized membrane protein
MRSSRPHLLIVKLAGTAAAVACGLLVCWESVVGLQASDPPVSQAEPPQKLARVLYFEGGPRAEAKFIMRATADDGRLRVAHLQRTGDGQYLRINVERPDELQNGFPTSRDELFAYQGLILGDVEAEAFTTEQHLLLAEFVSVRGGGLLALGGNSSFAEGGWSGTALAQLLPIALEAGDPGKTPRAARVTIKAPQTGLAHPATRIADTEAVAARLWSELPAGTIVNKSAAVMPGTTTLLTGVDASGREKSVLACHHFGNGKVAVFTLTDSWLWAMAGDRSDTHERFWRSLLRWLVDDVKRD